jgi:hypothetical protein
MKPLLMEILMIREVCNILFLMNKIKNDENYLNEICVTLKKPMIYKLFQNYKPDE